MEQIKRDFSKFGLLSKQSSFYTKEMMLCYTEELWQTCIKNRYQMIGESRTPIVSCSSIPIPSGLNRKIEVKLLGLMYKQNLLNLFLAAVQKKQCNSPLCECMEGDQSGFHILTACPMVDVELRNNLCKILAECNNIDSFIYE